MGCIKAERSSPKHVLGLPPRAFPRGSHAIWTDSEMAAMLSAASARTSHWRYIPVIGCLNPSSTAATSALEGRPPNLWACDAARLFLVRALHG
jgi:hypothetical protein